MARARRGLWSVALSVVVLMTQAACPNCGSCTPVDPSVSIPGGCVDAWLCTGTLVNAGRFEVRCTPDADGGWAACQCFHGGTPERVISNDGPWCYRHHDYDAMERIMDANGACGWSMSESNI